MKKTILFLTSVMALGAFAGCASTDTRTASKKEEPATAEGAKEEYVYVTRTGSWLPVKVKKSSVKPSAQETEDAQDGLSELQRRGVKQPKDG